MVCGVGEGVFVAGGVGVPLGIDVDGGVGVLAGVKTDAGGMEGGIGTGGVGCMPG